MKISALLLAGFELYRAALPGYRYEFPRDHFNHPEFQTEWWYYTGNLHDTQGRRFGFELTFFRHGVERGKTPASVWEVRDAWLAHLALSDIDGGQFLQCAHGPLRVRSGIPGLPLGRPGITRLPQRPAPMVCFQASHDAGEEGNQAQAFRLFSRAVQNPCKGFLKQIRPSHIGGQSACVQPSDGFEP